MNRRHCNTPAFTLVELLVVIGIIALLIGILIPTLGKAQQQAKATACMSNIKQLTTAWIMYANDNNGNLVFAETSDREDPGNLDKRDGWVVDRAGDPATNTRASIEKGLLWKYASAAETYRCPASYDSANFRSYSISTHMNGTPRIFYPDFYNSGYPPGSPPPAILTKISRVKPDRLVFIEEYDERGFNQGSFLQFRGMNQFTWGDIPAFFHKKGTVLSFADGHADYRVWSNPNTLKAKRAPDPWSNKGVNKDLQQLKIDMYGDPDRPKSSY
jgi:type II secretory pathway pseudopilin PulG